jgi:hypothetical protein
MSTLSSSLGFLWPCLNYEIEVLFPQNSFTHHSSVLEKYLGGKRKAASDFVAGRAVACASGWVSMRLNPTMPNYWVLVSASHSLDDRVRHRNFARAQLEFDAAANNGSLENRAPNFEPQFPHLRHSAVFEVRTFYFRHFLSFLNSFMWLVNNTLYSMYAVVRSTTFRPNVEKCNV